MYGLWQLRAHSGDLARCGMVIDAKRADDTFLAACDELKDDAVGLVDCLAPPDFVLNSTLGQALFLDTFFVVIFFVLTPSLDNVTDIHNHICTSSSQIF